MKKILFLSLPYVVSGFAVFFLWWPADVYVELRDLGTALLFLFSLIAVFSRSRSEAPPFPPSLWIVALFFICLVISSLSGVDSYRSAETVLRYLSVAVFAAALASVAGERMVQQSVTVLIGLVTCLCLYGFYQYLFSLPDLVRQPQMWSDLSKEEVLPVLTRMAGGRIFSRFALPSSFSCVLLATLPIVHRRILDRERPWLYAGVLVLLTANLVLARSYAAVLLFCLYGWVDAWIRHPHLRRSVLIPSTAVFILALLFLRPESILNFSDPANPIRLRAANWSVAWSEFLSAPVFGVGPGNFALLFPAYTSGLTETRYAHGFHMTMLAETGIAGTLVWLSLAGTFLFWILRTSSRSLAASLSLVFLYSLVDMVFEFPSLCFLFFLLCGLSVPAVSVTTAYVRPASLALSASGLAFSLVLLSAHGYYEQGMEFMRGSRISGSALQSADQLFLMSRSLWPHPETDAALGRVDLERYRLSPGKNRRYLQEAISHFSDAVRKSPAAVNGRAALAETLFAAGNMPESMRHFKEAARLDPRGPHLKRYTQILLGQTPQ